MTARPAALALAFVLALLVLGAGASEPFQKDAEPQSAEWIVSVARGGNWLIPRDYYGFADRKPPLYYWLSAIAVRATGGEVDEVRARAVSIVSGAALAAVILAWTAANVGVADGWLAYLFILGMYGFASRATLALTDMLLTALLFAALAIIYPLVGSPLQKGEGLGVRSNRKAVAAGVVLGLAILAKGPIALVLTALALAIFLLLERRNPIPMLRERWPWIATIIALGVGAGWYVPWFVSGGPEVRKIFLQENFGHFLPARMGGTGEASRPVWYILARLLGGSLPLAALLPAAILALWAANRARNILAQRLGREGGVIATRTHAIAYQSSLTLAVILFFSIASAKRDDYILPALPGIAILCASAVTFAYAAVRYDLAWARPIVRLFNVAVIAIAVTMLAGVIVAIGVANAGIALPFQLQSSDAEFMGLLLGGFKSERAPFLFFEIAVTLAAIIAWYAITQRRVIIAGAAVGVMSLAGSLLFCAVLRPALAQKRSLKYVAMKILATPETSGPLYVLRDDNFELSFYLGRAAPPITGRQAPPTIDAGSLFVFHAEVPSIPEQLRSRLSLVFDYPLAGRNGDAELYKIGPLPVK